MSTQIVILTVQIPKAVTRAPADPRIGDDDIDAVGRTLGLCRLEHALLVVPLANVTSDKGTSLAIESSIELLLDITAALVQVTEGHKGTSVDELADHDFAHAVGTSRDDNGFAAHAGAVGDDGVVDWPSIFVSRD